MTNNEIVVRALANTGITALNEMQQAVLDAGTTKDMVLLSPTGSGKTLAFLLPLLTTLTDEDKKIQAVIIAPSRELALQIETVKAAAVAAGMNKPSSSQINYIDLSAPDSVELCEAQNVSVLSRVFTSLGQGVFSVVEYFS